MSKIGNIVLSGLTCVCVVLFSVALGVFVCCTAWYATIILLAVILIALAIFHTWVACLVAALVCLAVYGFLLLYTIGKMEEARDAYEETEYVFVGSTSVAS